MTAETFFQLFNQYGLILVCAVVLLRIYEPAQDFRQALSCRASVC